MSSIIELTPTAEERASGRFSTESVERAARALREDGIVVLCDVVALEHVVKVRDRMLADVDRYLARPDRPFNWNSGNLQQAPPVEGEFLFRDIVANEYAIQVTKAILGAGLKSAFYSGNTALTSESRQPVHADSGQLWPNLEHATPPYALVVNLPLVDMGPENGSTEVWPGTHTDTTIAMQDGDIELPEASLAARRAVSPPIQPVVRAGSLVIRDIRLWHAGMPNRTQTPRPMAAMIHYVSWWPVGDPLKFPKGTETIFAHPDLYTHAEFVDDEIDYIGATGGYKYEEN